MRIFVLCSIVLLSTASPASAQISDFVVNWADASDSYIMSCPAGDGNPMSAAYNNGVPLDLRIRAKIETDYPWARYLTPADLPLESVHLVLSHLGDIYECSPSSVSIAAHASYYDYDTEEYVFSDPLDLGGNGVALVQVGAFYGSFEQSGQSTWMHFVSPDINGDGAVNLIDVNLFVTDFYSSTYASRSDFTNNGVVDLSDLPYISEHIPHDCQGAARAMLDGPSTPEEVTAMILDLDHPLWGKPVPNEDISWGALKSTFRQ